MFEIEEKITLQTTPLYSIIQISLIYNSAICVLIRFMDYFNNF